MSLATQLKTLSPTVGTPAVQQFLCDYLEPAFGARPKVDIELLVLKLLQDLGLVSVRPTPYELSTKLKIPTARARKLIYEQDLRTRTQQQLDEDLVELLRHPVAVRRGDQFVIQVENPLLVDHLRAKLTSLGHPLDGSFAASVVTLPIPAVASLVEHFIPADAKEAVYQRLQRAGVPGDGLKAVLQGVLEQYCKQTLGEANVEAGKALGRYLHPILAGKTNELAGWAKQLFATDKK